MSNVFRPILPPKSGYVEVLDADGNHIYKPTQEKQAQLEKEEADRTKFEELEKENKTLKAKVKASEESTAMLEECLCEMAEIVYA